MKKVERELCTLEAEIKQTKAKIAEVTKEVKELKGPISVAIRNALRAIGIELTIYWAGTFVGSQIAKLADWDRYKILLEAIEWTLATLGLNLTDNERMKCNMLMAETETVRNLFFNVHKRLKHTRTFSNTDIITLDSAILELSEAYRTFIPGPVTVKFHLLEAHVIPYIRKFCCYWRYSEEGVESAHHWTQFY